MSLLPIETLGKKRQPNELIQIIRDCGIVEEKIILQLLKLLVSQSDAFSVLDQDLRFVFISENYKNVLEIQDEKCQLIGMHVTEVLCKIINKEVSMISQNRLHAASLVAAAKETKTFLRTTRTGKDVMATISPLLDDNGNILFIIQSIKNLPDIDQLRSQNMAFYEAIGLHAGCESGNSPIIHSKCMQEVAERAYQAAGADVNVLLTGESGVGKDVIAKYIQSVSPRKSQQFIQVNCSAIPDGLLESELFGYEDGAFTGARRSGKHGLIEIAHKGTLFLDEIGDMPLPLQAKLLNFLQDRYFFRVGGVDKVKVDIRIIAATNANLEEKVKRKEFREDLYYRLKVIPIHIPPLRERPEDIIPMVNDFLSQFNRKYAKNKQFSFDALCLLATYPWPGNVRELKNSIERLVVLGKDQQINVDIIKKELEYSSHDSFPEGNASGVRSLEGAKEQIEYQLFKLAAQHYNSHRQIAKALGTSPSTVGKKLEQYGIRVG